MPFLAPSRNVSVIIVTAAIALSSACGGGASEDEVQQAVERALASQQASTPASPSTAPTVTATVAPPAAPPAAAPAPPAPAEPQVETVDFVMPDFTGANLQDAQDSMQTLGVFFSVSHDSLASRSQLLDSNWRVCDQIPAAGTAIRGAATDFEGKIDFGAVKLEETCP